MQIPKTYEFLGSFSKLVHGALSQQEAKRLYLATNSLLNDIKGNCQSLGLKLSGCIDICNSLFTNVKKYLEKHKHLLIYRTEFSPHESDMFFDQVIINIDRSYYKLAMQYWDGRNVAQDYNKAAYLFKKSFDKERNKLACFFLGLYYYKYGPYDIQQSFFWFFTAMVNSDYRAHSYVKEILSKNNLFLLNIYEYMILTIDVKTPIDKNTAIQIQQNEKPIIIVPLLGKSFEVSFYAFADLVMKVSDVGYLAYIIVATALSVDYATNIFDDIGKASIVDKSVEVHESSKNLQEMIMSPITNLVFPAIENLRIFWTSGGIIKYNKGEISTELFIHYIRMKIPLLKNVEDDDIINAWIQQSIPSEEQIQIYCKIFTKAELIFTSKTNYAQSRAFLNALEENCDDFNREDHYYAFSYLSKKGYTEKLDLVQEAIDDFHLANRDIYSCHREVNSIKADHFYYVNQDNLMGCINLLHEVIDL